MRIVGGRQAALNVVVIVQAKADLLEIVGALQTSSGAANFLDGRHEQADQDRDDGDHDQEFDEGEAGRARTISVHGDVSFSTSLSPRPPRRVTPGNAARALRSRIRMSRAFYAIVFDRPANIALARRNRRCEIGELEGFG